MKVLLVALSLVLVAGSVGCGGDARLSGLSDADEVKAYTLVSDGAPLVEKRITDPQSIATIVRIVRAAPVNEKAMRSLGLVTKPAGGHDPFQFFSKGRYLGKASFWGDDGLAWDGVSGFMFKILSEEDRKILRRITAP